MKRKLFFPFFVVLLCLCGRMPIYADNDVSMHVTNRYKYYDGKKTGRQVIISTSQTITSASICHSGSWQQVPLKNMEAGQYELLLPDPIGVKQPDTLTVRLMEQKKTICERILTVGKMRHWEVLIFHHSHVDIGYTQTQKVVEFIHRQNIEQAIELSEKTKDYPDDARFRWNTEVSWPMERYLKTASPEKRERALQAIRQGSISVDMSYLNTNTSAAHEPELMELYSASHRIEELTGRSTHTMVQVDVPGFTWGIPALSKLTGVRYVLSLPNAADRVGRARELDLRPMYWLAPDGVNKVLFVQGGPYCMAAHWKRNPWFFDNLGVKDTTLLPKVVRTDNPRAIFLDGELDANLPMLENNPAYVYDVYPQPWCMSDNVPIDADLPDAVKSWNEEFAFPHLRISNSSEIMAAYERYADHIPTVSGDYTEYWTDGLGTSAYHTGRHREVKERLMQAEILSCITGSPLPDEECSEAWRYALLGTEHTWAYIYPDQPISDEILDVKFGYFKNADSLQQDLMARVLAPLTVEGSPTIAVFNTEDHVRSGLVRLPATLLHGANMVIDTETGRIVPSQKLSDGRLAFRADDLHPLSSRKYRLKQGKRKRERMVPPSVTDTIDNGKIRICVDPHTGNLVSLVKEGREFINQKSSVDANSYRYLLGGQTPTYATSPYDVKITWAEYGPLQKTLLVTSSADGCRSLIRKITILDGDSAVYLENTIDKIATVAKEGIHFGFSFNMGQVVRLMADVPWGVMQLEKDQWPEANRNWMCMHRWVNVSDSTANVTLCSLNAPVFEVGDLSANIIGSSGNWIKSSPSVPIIWSWVLNNHWHTNFRLSQGEPVTCRYALLPSVGKADAAVSNRFAQGACRELVCCPVAEGYESRAPFNIKADPSTIVSCIRPANGNRSMIVCLRSLSERPQEVEILPCNGMKAYRSDAYGKRLSEPATTFRLPAQSTIAVRVDKQ